MASSHQGCCDNDFSANFKIKLGWNNRILPPDQKVTMQCPPLMMSFPHDIITSETLSCNIANGGKVSTWPVTARSLQNLENLHFHMRSGILILITGPDYWLCCRCIWWDPLWHFCVAKHAEEKGALQKKTRIPFIATFLWNFQLLLLLIIALHQHSKHINLGIV